MQEMLEYPLSQDDYAVCPTGKEASLVDEGLHVDGHDQAPQSHDQKGLCIGFDPVVVLLGNIGRIGLIYFLVAGLLLHRLPCAVLFRIHNSNKVFLCYKKAKTKRFQPFLYLYL